MMLGGFEFFGPYASIDPIADRPGVYAVVGLKCNQSYLIDVGGAGTLRDWLALHEREQRWRELARTDSCALAYFVHYTSGDHRSHFEEIEQTLRRIYDPPCCDA
jgi:hypothetical protein